MAYQGDVSGTNGTYETNGREEFPFVSWFINGYFAPFASPLAKMLATYCNTSVADSSL